MSLGHKLYWLLVVATVLLYATMIFWAGPQISDMSTAEKLPFDLRMFGYTHEEAQNFVASLSPGGLAFYLGPAMLLDTFFPAMFALVLGLGCWFLLAHRPLLMRVAALLIAAFYALFDYLENLAVTRMLNTHPEELPVQLAETASRWTVLKFFFVDAAITVLLVLLIARLITWLRKEQSDAG